MMKETYNEINELIDSINVANNETLKNKENSGVVETNSVAIENFLKSLKTNVDELYDGTKERIEELENDVVELQTEIRRLEDENDELISSLEYINTTPFIAITSMLLNISGTIIVGIFMTESKIYYALSGGAVVLIGSLLSVFFPYAKKWFNKES